ncbi:MAG TPA: LemA family protein [Synergistaceae bacterium]|nr:LemA family protein [Synergistaceae bacterium]HQF91779.1 LemA family protein [Synergistaceae bacterium]HQH77812.1 LemA family protein [Synergistaceae bacterium]HQK25064.1 LemA family protein [Synergistaceae bacterium]
MTMGWAAGVLLALALGGVILYNGLVRKRNDVENGWSQIDVQLKRRHDLIPNLVATVQGYARHEKELFERVALLRSQALGASDLAGRLRSEGALSGAMKSLLMVAEAYPDLKASANFLALQEELASTENRIAFARQYYNTAVNRYNTATETFPGNLVAKGFSFGRRELWQIDDVAERAPGRIADLAGDGVTKEG